MTVEQIIDLIGCAESSIRAWAQAYKQDGITALQLHYEHSAQNASKFSQADIADFRQAHPNGVILALDQMSTYLQTTLKRVWSPIGQTPYVWVTPQRRGTSDNDSK